MEGSSKTVEQQQRLGLARSVLNQAEVAFGLKDRAFLQDFAQEAKPSKVWGGSNISLSERVKTVMGTSGWAAVLGRVSIGWAAWAEMGIDLGRVLYLPSPEERALWVMETMLGAVEVVVYEAELFTSSQLLRLEAKAKARDTLLLAYSLELQRQREQVLGREVKAS
ncbi:hypothetical protein [Boudabousia marimammalium]|uniref:Uncharacterized protein n=1 Tax=Boudabousia marimammalium TaxID=156892 RepID=A0A1Q5PRI3_9ACTO|nr:hypothetical protein [Boudabousia marimammalium]OKL50052.1 hypothetical protein BM477_03980 [Boudabousia marimammalium]